MLSEGRAWCSILSDVPHKFKGMGLIVRSGRSFPSRSRARKKHPAPAVFSVDQKQKRTVRSLGHLFLQYQTLPLFKKGRTPKSPSTGVRFSHGVRTKDRVERIYRIHSLNSRPVGLAIYHGHSLEIN